MLRLFFNLRDGVEHLLDPEGVELPDLEAAKAHAKRSAYSIMADDVAHGKLKLNYRIDIENEAGEVLATVRFRDLVEFEGIEAA